MAPLQLYFLGPLGIRSGDRELLKPPTLKSQSLLAYLALHRDRSHSRGHLVGLFWGEQPEAKARRSLSTALWHIRRCLPDPSILLSDSNTVQFDPQSDLWLDVEAFDVQVSRHDPVSLQSAAALYRGDFLDGFFDDWILSERYRLEALFLEALALLMVAQELAGEYQSALGTALRLLSRDPLQEDAHRLAMRAYCQLGQRKAALDQYARCREILLDELGVEPAVESTALYQAILEGRFKVGPPSELLPLQTPKVEPVGRSPLDVIVPVRLVGRDRELVLLDECWQETRKGCGRVVLISGEGGVGKTRLVEEFANRLRWQGAQVLWGRCYEFERTLPYQPFAEALQRALLTLNDGALKVFPGWALDEVARLVPEVLERPASGETRPTLRQGGKGRPGLELSIAPGSDPEQARLFQAVTRLLAELSSGGPLLLVLEDLHWASESTLGLLHHLAHHLSDHPVLIVGTFRPEATGLQHPLPDLKRGLSREALAQPLHLARLSPQAVETMIVEMSGAGQGVMPLAKRFYQETEGNPFFLMEIVKALFETQVLRLEEGVWHGDFARICQSQLPLPASLSDAIQARARRLGQDTQDALCLAAVLGREFNFDLLNAVWGKGEEAVLEALDDLLRRRLVEECSDRSDNDFAFTHHKIQEVIYQGLQRHRRTHLHARVGAAMEAIYAAELETRAGELAHHFEQACPLNRSLCSKAISYLLQAGQHAVRQSANLEAISYFRRGLDILHSLPESQQGIRQEIDLQIALALPTTVLHGYASRQAKGVYDRARNLCQKLGETPALFTTLVGLARYYGVGGDTETSLELAGQMLAIAQKSQDTDLLLEAYREMGGNLFSLGRLKEARAFWERGFALYDPAQHENHAYRFGHDPVVTCLGYLSWTLWLLGYPEQAQVCSQHLNELQLSMTHPSSRAYACCLLATQACMRHDAQATRDHAQTAIQLGQVHGLPSWTAWATALWGWAISEQGQAAEGLACLNDGTAAFQARGFKHLVPFFLALQAEACLKVQLWIQAMESISAALVIAQAGEDRFWLAELNRLQGELLRCQGEDSEAVEKHYYQAMGAAHQQEARMLELRAAMSLTRLWCDQGRPKAARQVLEEVFDQFTEGFESCDLKAANALLKELL